MSEHIIDFLGVYKEYDGVEVLSNINLYIRQNEFLTLLGPSGCGKTTLLRIIAGFEEPTRGDVHLFGESIKGLPPYKRRVNTVFQKYALFPHLNVFDNIAFGLKIKKMDKTVIRKKVEDMLRLVGLSGYGDRDIAKLSGGQQQRVAIARALVNEPEVLLLDEPLGALDLKLRKEMQIELKRMQKKLGITFIFVTHDQEEALTMSDTIAVMNHGIIQQIGCPTDVYNEPKNRFVARFIGESNIFEATMRRDYLVNIHGIDYECVDAGFGTEQPVDVVIRPEDVDFVPIGKTPLHGVVTSVLFMGVHYEFTVDCDGRIFKVHSTDFVPVGETVGIEVLPDAIHIMNPERRQPTEAAAEEPQQNL